MTSSQPITKAVALLVMTLILGLCIGSLGTLWFVKQRINALQAIETTEGFVQVVSNAIGPMDAQQQQQVTPLLRATGKQVAHEIQTARDNIQPAINQLFVELEVHLTPEQLATLKARRERIRIYRQR